MGIGKHLTALVSDKFRVLLLCVLAVVLSAGLVRDQLSHREATDGIVLEFYFHPGCPHCKHQRPFNRWLLEHVPNVRIVENDVSTRSGAERLREALRSRQVGAEPIHLPVSCVQNRCFSGFTAETAQQIQNAISTAQGNTSQPVWDWRPEGAAKPHIPVIGDINPNDYSLFLLTVILGLADGFNPCAMWVLAYLISVLVGMGNQRKVWLLVGSFIMASGILYFLFLTAWLNVFLVIGYMRIATMAIGLAAIWLGAISIRDFVVTKGMVTCPVSADPGSRQGRMERIRTLATASISAYSILGIIALAFVVNSVEFVCSAGIPAVYTYVLSMSALDSWSYYGYLLLYDLCFMLDDTVIFVLAAMWCRTATGMKYASYSKLIGGIVLLALGLMLTLAPELLR